MSTGAPCPLLQEKRPGREVDLSLVPRLRMSGALPLLLTCLRGVHRNGLTLLTKRNKESFKCQEHQSIK